MAKPTARIAAIQFGFALGVLAVLTRAAQLQIVEGERWEQRGRAAADREGGAARAARRALRPERRAARHHPGVLSRRRRAERARGRPARRSCCWCRNLGVSAPALDREFQARKRWIYLHGPFNATQVQPLRGGERRPPRRASSSASIPRATSRGRSSAGSRPTGRSAALGPRAGARLAAHRPRRARRCCSRIARAAATTRPAGRRATRWRATTSSSRSTPSCRRSPSAGSTTRIEQMQAEGGDVVFLDPEHGRAARAGVPAGRGRRRCRSASTLHRSRSSPARPPSCSPRRPCSCTDGSTAGRRGVRRERRRGRCR